MNVMNVHDKNRLLQEGRLEVPGLFPKLEELGDAAVVFTPQFGLPELPGEPGIILIRGARQLGKSTWLEEQIRNTIITYGPGTACYLNGDELGDQEELFRRITEQLLLLKPGKIRRLFIDEITAVKEWERALKRLADQGILRQILTITTGSKMIDLRRGTERLPGRKGRLNRTNYIFTPISFAEFKPKTIKYFASEDLLWAYSLTGGSPVAINALIRHGMIPEYIVEMTRDWVLGETARQGRSSESLKWVLLALFARAGTPVSLHVLAREASLANNTVARGYIELLKDLACLSSTALLDTNRLIPIPRKASKYHFINLLAVTAFHPGNFRRLDDLKNLSPQEKGKWREWLVAQELWRRAAIEGRESPEQQYFWQSSSHEIDFLVLPGKDRADFIEVKSGPSSPSEFTWFPPIFPRHKLHVISESNYDSIFCQGNTFEEFLLADMPTSHQI